MLWKPVRQPLCLDLDAMKIPCSVPVPAFHVVLQVATCFASGLPAQNWTCASVVPSSAAMAFDSDRGRVVMFGGSMGTVGIGATPVTDRTSEWDGMGRHQ